MKQYKVKSLKIKDRVMVITGKVSRDVLHKVAKQLKVKGALGVLWLGEDTTMSSKDVDACINHLESIRRNEPVVQLVPRSRFDAQEAKYLDAVGALVIIASKTVTVRRFMMSPVTLPTPEAKIAIATLQNLGLMPRTGEMRKV